MSKLVFKKISLIDFNNSFFRFFLLILFLFPLKFLFAKTIFYLCYLFFLVYFNKFYSIAAKQSFYYLFSFIYLFIILQFFHGYFVNNPGVSNYIILYLISPIFYIYIFFNNATDNSFKIFIDILSKAVIFFSLIIWYKIINVLTFISFYPLDVLCDFYEVKVNSFGLFEISTHLLILIQFYFVFSTALRIYKLKIANNNLLFGLSYILSFVILLFSGKTGIYLSVFLFLLFFVFIKNFKFGILILSLLCLFYLSFQEYFNIYLDFYSLYSESNTVNVRVDQYSSLINGIKDNFIFGSGIGAFTKDRDTFNWIQPWAYELQYLSHLFHFGFPIFLFFVISYIFIFIKAFISKSTNIEADILSKSLLIGVSSVLLINSINPIISKFDFVWIFFIPIWIYNKRINYKSR